MPRKKFFHIKNPELTFLEGGKNMVSFPVSCEYNGGISIDGEYYNGFLVDKPTIPEGYELVDMFFGLQYNSKPPLKIMKIRRK